MFVRLTHFTIPAAKMQEIKKMYYEEVAPVIKLQPGLVDLMLLEPVGDSEEFISCTSWKSEADIRAFESSHSYPEVIGKIKVAASSAPLQKYYNVG